MKIIPYSPIVFVSLSSLRNRILLLILLVVGSTALSGCELGYVLSQGYLQLRLLSERRPVDETLADPAVDPVVKEKIRLVQRVRVFGETWMRLRTSDAYTTYIETEGDFVAYVVSAAPKDRLEPYLWRFPLVGSFPYKGFFRLKDARAAKRTLADRGYDTHLSGAVAYSSLGWFSDPLYSSILRLDEIDLIYTILHEMVHATTFFSSQVDFNEQFATFVGWQGTIAFLKMTGNHAESVERVAWIVQDEKRLSQYLERAHGLLSTLYSLPVSKAEKVDRRSAILNELEGSFHRIYPEFKTPRFSALKGLEWNNASFLGLWRYRYDIGSLDRLHHCLGADLQMLISTAREWQESKRDPNVALEQMLTKCDLD
jgi:predicted aminopeptidase